MHFSKWVGRIRKSVRSNQSLKSPKIARVFAIALVALIAVAGLVLAAYQATPSKAAAPAVQPVTTQSTALVQKSPARKSNAAHAVNGAQTAEPVTLTGCLEQNHDVFRLKNTQGVDAPKSRSWKTGFLTKHAASVTVVDGRNRLRLGNHVGEKVSVSGLLLDRELEGRSISRVAESCD